MYDERPRTESQDTTRNTVFINRPATSNQVMGQTQQTLVPKINNLIQQQQPNIIENEVYANNWLKSNYDEVHGSGPIKIQDIYAEYVKFCCRNSRKNVIANQSFNLLLRKCFPSCIINAYTVEGIVPKLRQQTTVVTANQLVAGQPNQLMSPILKAHLSTPPKANSPMPSTTSGNDGNVQQEQPTTTTTSTLIKSLLANKLRNNQQVVTVPSSTPNMSVNVNKIGATSIGTSSANQIVIQNQSQQQQPQTPNIPNAITTNNFIGAAAPPAGGQQQTVLHHPQQQQQLMLVRTIITMPNGSQAVRLILPSSMLHQRLPVSGVNGMITGAPNNMVQTVATSQPIAVQHSNIVLPQQQPLTPTSVASITTSTAPQSSPATTSEPTKSVPLVAQTPTASSPLLNVLLDKGKLPEQTPTAVVVMKEESNNLVAITATSQNNTASVAPAPTNKIDAKPVIVNQVNNVTPQTTTPLVNGDAKLNDLLAQGNGKRALESVNNEDSEKKLKVESSTALVTTKQTTANQPTNTQNNKDEKQSGENVVSTENKVAQPVTNHVIGNASTVLSSQSVATPLASTSASPVVVPSSPVASRLVQPAAAVVTPVKPQPRSDPAGEYECQWGQCSM